MRMDRWVAFYAFLNAMIPARAPTQIDAMISQPAHLIVAVWRRVLYSLLAALLVVAPVEGVSAQMLTTLHTFTGNPDGKIPYGGVVLRNSRLYGTTFEGGAHDSGFGGGTVFELIPEPHGTQWTANILVNFYGATQGKNCSEPIVGPNSVAGFGPVAPPTFDSMGNMYAPASQSGCDEGTVVELTSADNTYSVTNALQFQLGYPKRKDTRGNTPDDWGGLIFDTGGNVYGTTVGDGLYEAGEVFKLGAGLPSNVVTLLANFKTSNADGNGPQTGLVFGPNGVLYGTTSGTFNGGAPYSTIFQLNADGGIVVLHTFETGTGIGPGPIVLRGNKIYGATENGGTLTGGGGQGVVYELDVATKQYTVLHTFGAGGDGAHPFSIKFGKSGVIFGNAVDGGAHSSGMLFELTPPASASESWTESDLWDFSGSGADGGQPIGTLAIDKSGALYGTTEGGTGGPANYGTVYKLVP
jgi:uncharacterized repeat protein (TIGR03803 family)